MPADDDSEPSSSSSGSPRPGAAGKASKTPAREEDQPYLKLCEAAARGDVTELASLLTEGKIKDVNWRKPADGNSALHVAAEEGFEQAVQALVDARADPELNNDFGLKPINLAPHGTAVFALLMKVTKPMDESQRRGAFQGAL
mmetsp:Transcript_129304/g.253235  ORF Transcript_129304/g.253235 Transcript_129304/m.253235 type:complete len:143 (+) Transcript_129304:64-492(+)